MEKKNMEEMKCFRYQGVGMAINGTKGNEASHGVGEGAKALGTLRNV